MFGIPEWAIGAGFVTAAFFAGIGLMLRVMPAEMRMGGRKKRLSDEEQRLLDEAAERTHEVEEMRRQLGDLESRLDFAERLLTKQAERERLAPPPSL